MTCYVSNGTLNHTHSFTHWRRLCCLLWLTIETTITAGTVRCILHNLRTGCIRSTDAMLMSWNRIFSRYHQTLGRLSLMRPSLSGWSDFRPTSIEGTSLWTFTVNITWISMIYFTAKMWLNVLKFFYWILLTLQLLWEGISWFPVLTVTSLILCWVIILRTHFCCAEMEWYSTNNCNMYYNCNNARYSLRHNILKMSYLLVLHPVSALSYILTSVHFTDAVPRLRYDLLCVEWDVKPYTLAQFTNARSHVGSVAVRIGPTLFPDQRS